MKMLDPVCDMVVDLEDARDHEPDAGVSRSRIRLLRAGLSHDVRQVTERFKPKMDAWLAERARGERAHATAHVGELSVVDAGVRERYKVCRCCMHDAYPQVVEQLDAERDANAEAQSPDHP
jgi:hypothetical protein